MVNLDLIVLFSILLGVVEIFMGIILAGRFAGKLRTGVIFLTIAIIIFTIKISVNFLDIFGQVNFLNIVLTNNLSNLGIILFLFLTLHSMFSMARNVKSGK